MSSQSTPPGPAQESSASARPIWKSKTLAAAAAMMLVGLAMWISRPSEQDQASRSRSAVARSAGSGFANSSDSGSSVDGERKNAVRPKSPALFRFGSSYIGGFFIGFAFRKFLKWSLLISGAVITGIFLLKRSGVIDLDWSGLEGQVSQSVAWAQGQAGAVKQFLTGHLPSAGAGIAGLFMGARRS